MSNQDTKHPVCWYNDNQELQYGYVLQRDLDCKYIKIYDEQDQCVGTEDEDDLGRTKVVFVPSDPCNTVVYWITDGHLCKGKTTKHWDRGEATSLIYVVDYEGLRLLKQQRKLQASPRDFVAQLKKRLDNAFHEQAVCEDLLRQISQFG